MLLVPPQLKICLILRPAHNEHVYHRIKTLLPIYHRRLIKKISLDRKNFVLPFIQGPKTLKRNEEKFGWEKAFEARASISRKYKRRQEKKLRISTSPTPSDTTKARSTRQVIIFFSFPFGITLKMLRIE